MAVSNVNPYNSKMRLSGLSGSGLDTDAIISQLMKAQQVPLDKLKQKKELTEWKRDAYRDITNLLRGIKDDYFNRTKPANNMLSANAYKKYTFTSSDSTVVSVTANADAAKGNHTITVEDLAAAEIIKSSGMVSKQITGGSLPSIEAVKGKSFTMVVDGVTKTITIGNSITNESDLISNIQNSINTAFGPNKITVTDTNNNGTGYLKFIPKSGSGVSKISIFSGPNESSDALNGLGFSSPASNQINTADTLETLASKLNIPLSFDVNGQIDITINGKEFKFNKTTTLSSMMSTINNDSTANVNLKYDDVNDKFVITAKQTGAGSNMSISEGGSTFLNAIGIKNVAGSNTFSGALKDYTGNVKKFNVVIDGVSKEISLDGDYSTYTSSDFSAMLKSKIEAAFTDKTVVVGSSSGALFIYAAGSSVSVSEPASGTSALSDLGLTANYSAGQDAKVILDGQTVVRSSNNFSISGVTYKLLKESTTQQTVSISLDVNGIYDNIKKFVDKYNEAIKTINDKLVEKSDKNYQPLTDDQRESLSEKQIEKWETKAKTGLLRNDTLLQNITYGMRRALSDSVSDISIKLSDIGITTGSYEEKGILHIDDEDKLKNAIQSNPDAVANLFVKESSITTNLNLTTDQKSQRYNEEGLAYRLYDIIEDNVRTIRDKDGKKGILLEKAGIVGELSEIQNTMYEEIHDYDDSIYDMQKKLVDKENAYYKKYANLETMLSKMNSQSSWLSSQFKSS